MLDRYLITLGAPTSAGGKVTSASRSRTINGVPVAAEGDTCWCPACRSEGVIRADGPRLSDTLGEREIALQDDLCICRCSPPPRLLAAQAFMCQSIDTDWHAGKAAAAAEAVAIFNAAAISAAGTDSAPLVLIDPDTQEPLRNRPYRLELADTVIEGTLDDNGCTEPLTAAQRSAVVTWQVPTDGA